ncbi:hypothetical protein Tco_0806597, partial [Tanacetum coccineum]
MAWLDDEPIRYLNTMEDKVDNVSPQRTLQVLPSFEVYTSPVTHPEEVEETIGIQMEVEPLDHMKLEDLSLDTSTHDLFLSSKGFPGSGPNWLFDIDALTKSINYKPIVAGNQSNGNAGTKACHDAGKSRMETIPDKDYILLPLWNADPPFSQSSKSSPDAGFKPSGDDEKKKEDNVNSTNTVNAASINEVDAVGAKTSIKLLDDPNMLELEDIVYSDDDEDVAAEADMNNLDAFMPFSPILTTRIHKDHLIEQIIRDLNSTPQTRRMTKNLEEHEPKKVIQALHNPSWIEVMKDELQQFKLQK